MARMIRFLASLLFLLFTLLWCEVSQSDNPISIGQSCTDLQSTYRWSTSVRTAWSVGDLYAVPIGTTKPDEWSNAAAFHDSLLAVLHQNPTAGDYAQACGSVWRQFFADRADVIALPQRTISVTIREIRCVSNVWSIVSETSSTNQDDTGWAPVGNESFDFSDSTSTTLLSTRLQTLVDQLNNQPGADQSTVESYVKEQ